MEDSDQWPWNFCHAQVIPKNVLNSHERCLVYWLCDELSITHNHTRYFIKIVHSGGS